MKRVVIIATAFILLIILLMVDWVEKPREWVIGRWYEVNHDVYAQVTPETVTLEVTLPGRKRTITRQYSYELMEKEKEFTVKDLGGRQETYAGLFEFKGKDKVIVRPKPGKNRRDLEALVEGLSSTWVRVKEGK